MARTGSAATRSLLVTMMLCFTGLASTAEATVAAPVDFDEECLPIVDRCPDWVRSIADVPDQRLVGSIRGPSKVNAVSGDGQRVYSTASVEVGTDDFETAIRTVAYEASSGAIVWSRDFSGLSAAEESGGVTGERPQTLLFSEGADAVVLVGNLTREQGAGNAGEIAVVAYDAATGEERWSVRRRPDDRNHSVATDAVVSRDGTRLYVSAVTDAQLDARLAPRGLWTVFGFDLTTGAELWATKTGVACGSCGSTPFGLALAEGESGREDDVVVTTGQDVLDPNLDDSGDDYHLAFTRAFDAESGAVTWNVRTGGTITRDDGLFGTLIAASPDGETVYVGGEFGSDDFTPSPLGQAERRAFYFGARAYDAETGTALWTNHYHPGTASKSVSVPHALAVAPDGRHLYMAGRVWDDGYSTGTNVNDCWNYGIVAVSLAPGSHGQAVWMDTHDGGLPGAGGHISGDLSDRADTVCNGNGYSFVDVATGIAVSRNSGKVYVTGGTSEIGGTALTTIAYSATAGTDFRSQDPRLWTYSYVPRSATNQIAYATSIVASPVADRVFVSGLITRSPAAMATNMAAGKESNFYAEVPTFSIAG